MNLSVDIENIRLVTQGAHDLVHFLAGVDIQGQANGGDP